jgi:hypothetical protein
MVSYIGSKRCAINPLEILYHRATVRVEAMNRAIRSSASFCHIAKHSPSPARYAEIPSRAELEKLSLFNGRIFLLLVCKIHLFTA